MYIDDDNDDDVVDNFANFHNISFNFYFYFYFFFYLFVDILEWRFNVTLLQILNLNLFSED